jgi:hypothetical protein
MAGSLTAIEVAAYERDGYFFPRRVMAAERAAELADRIGDLERRFSDRYPVAALLRAAPSMVVPFVDGLMREAAIVDAVETILGPDVMVWATDFFIKEAGSPRFVSWHQDLTYWGLSSAEQVTAWIAFTPANPETGCMRFIAGSHAHGIVRHEETYAPDNILSRGQTIAGIEDEGAVDVVLAPGEVSLHHGRMFHASGPNRSGSRRIGLAIRYIPPSVRQVIGKRDYAALVRGEDRFGHFDAPPRPKADFAEDAVAFARRALADVESYIYEGAKPDARRYTDVAAGKPA